MTTPTFATFYVDDSICEILGKKHFILAAVTFDSEDDVLAAWIQQKAKFCLPPHTEVRWNSRNLSIAQRRAFVPIASRGVSLVVVDDRSKQLAAMQLGEQAFWYCHETGLSGFRLRFDENIVSDRKALKTHVAGFNPPCVGLCEADSQYEHLLQAADFLAGAVKLQIDFALGNRDPNEEIFLIPDGNGANGLQDKEACDLGGFMFANLRYCIWGRIHTLPGRPEEPWKATRNRGLIVHSAASEEIIAKAVARLDDFYMGCIH